MGYAQQIGDIQTGGQQTLRNIRGQAMQAAGQRGFSGSGIGQRNLATAFGDLRTDIARQRRGVVEGYQADVLSAIGDIERKGEFEFGMSAKDYEQTEGAMAKLRQQKGMLGKLFSNVSDEKLREMLQSSQG